MNKFHARKVEIDGIGFPSQAEANRFCQLRLLERARVIRAMSRQPQYPLSINGVTIGLYTADFAYIENGRHIAEDVKGGPIREADSLRMRVFMALYPHHELRIVDRKGGWKPMKQRKVLKQGRAAA